METTKPSSVHSSFLGTDTRSTQIANAIERDILSGVLVAGSPLKRVRELASDFHVSSTVIFDAMNILEKKQMITREPRRGIYVRPLKADHVAKEVLLFAMDREPGVNVFVQKMLRIVQSPYTKGKLNFTIRLVGTQRVSSCGNLDQELLHLEQMRHYDCVLFLTMGFLRKDVERVSHFPYPCIFVGDLSEGDYDDLRYLRIAATDKGNAECILHYAEQCGYHNVVYVFPEHIYSTYIKKFYADLSSLFELHGIHTIPLAVPGVTLADTSCNVGRVLLEHKKVLESCDLLLSRYFHIPDPGFPLPDICYLNECEDLSLKQVCCSFEPFFRRICDLIFTIDSHWGKREIFTLDLDAEICQYCKTLCIS